MRFITLFLLFTGIYSLSFAQTKEELIKELEKTIDSISNSGEAEEKLKRVLKYTKLQESEVGGVVKQIALCNYLIEQACILEALNGRGVGIVRKELTENINDHGLSNDNKRHLRRLIELCE